MTQANSALDTNKNTFPFMKIKSKYIFIQPLVKLQRKSFLIKISFKSTIFDGMTLQKSYFHFVNLL